MNDEPRAADAETAESTELSEVVVVAVTDADESFDDSSDDGEPGDFEQSPEDALLALAEANREHLDETLADLQQELAGMAKTGIPGVDAALDRLAELDPNDLPGSTELLTQVLAQLESVMREAPKE